MINPQKTTVFDCELRNISQLETSDGFKFSSFINDSWLSNAIKRIYYIYDIPEGEERGAHGHKQLEQLIIAVNGNFELHLNDGKNNLVVELNSRNKAFYIVPGIWRDLRKFSANAVCLVLASREYEASDYIRDYQTYLDFKKI